MFMWLSMRWWYSAGWGWAWKRAVLSRLKSCAATFSIGLLLRTWFAPFKQTYAGGVRGSIGAHFRAFFDKTISRVIGAMVRSIIILAGLVCLILVAVSGLLFILAWPFIPAVPALGVILALSRTGA